MLIKEKTFEEFESQHSQRNRKRDAWVESLKQHLGDDLIIAEIGVSVGVNSKRIVDILEPKEFYLIDPWNFDDYGPDLPIHKYMKDFVYHKLGNEECVHIIEDYSYNALSNFPDETFDYIYIDGEHDYDNVMKDLICSYPKVKSGGLIGGHDYWETHEVIPAVNEFIKNKKIVDYSLPSNPERGKDGNSDFFFVKM
mgnify:CR=1 FL=1|tara:strand:+ start:664 stop:1251 length:588 start_codon:yes stop_codon:yes gene_type:complete